MDPLVSLLVAALLLVVPGGLLLAVAGPRSLPSPWLALPLASVLSLGLLTVALGTTMLLQASSAVTYALLGGASVALAVALPFVRRPHARAWRRLDAPDVIVALAALAAAVLGFVVQGSLQSDTLYHVAQGIKVADLRHVGVSNTLQFVDGSAHPGYLVPTFQALIGLSSKGRDALELTLLLPVLTAPLGVLAAAALGHVAAGTRRAGAIAALAFLAYPVLGTAPRFVPLAQSSYGGVFVLAVVLPCIVALVVAALLPDRGDRIDRTRLLVAAAAGTLLVGVLHASYLSLLAMPMLGLATGWLWSRPHEQGEVRRIALALGTVFAAACAITVALMPFLARLRSFTQTGSADAIKGLDPSVDRPDAVDAARLFVGGGKHFHLRADALVADGGIVLVLLVLLFACGVLLRRSPLGWLALGCTALVLVVSQWGAAFGTLAAVMGADQARRLGEALPLVLGFVAIGEVLAGAARRGRARLAQLLSATVAAAAVVAALLVPVLRSRGDDPVFPQWPVVSLAVVAAVAVLVLLVLPALRGRWPRLASPPAWPALRGLATDHLALAALPVLAALAVATATAWDDLGDRMDLHRDGTSRAELVSFSDADVRAIRSLPPGSIVLSDVRHRTSFRIMAYAPVYVIGAPAGHVANTRRNDIRGRLARVERLLQPSRTPDERRQDLDRFHVDAVVLRDLPRYEPVAEALRGPLADEWRELRHDGDYAVFVRRDAR